LFSLDAFASGFVVQSLLAMWLFERFNFSHSAASLFFFWSSVLSAFSYPVAAALTKRIGLVKTMVYRRRVSWPASPTYDPVRVARLIARRSRLFSLSAHPRGFRVTESKSGE
jgi:hypothetical protein